MNVMEKAEDIYFSVENPTLWTQMSICSIANCGRFSSDRTISDYCEEVWNVEDLSIPKGSTNPN